MNKRDASNRGSMYNGQLHGELKDIEIPLVGYGKQMNDRRYGSAIYLDSHIHERQPR